MSSYFFGSQAVKHGLPSKQMVDLAVGLGVVA